MKQKEKMFAAGLVFSMAVSGAIIGGTQLKPLVEDYYALRYPVQAEEAAPQEEEEMVPAEESAPEWVPETAGPDVSDVLDLSSFDAFGTVQNGTGDQIFAGDGSDAPGSAQDEGGGWISDQDFFHEEGLSSVGWTDDYEFLQVDHSYFSDALFIGDSRTVGIRLYGGLPEPVYFASTGLSVFTVGKDSVEVKGYGKLNLNQVLAKKTYGKIFIMLGINELSNSKEKILEKYQTVIDTVRAAQPDAILYLCANLHVTGKKSATDKVFRNERINALNDGIAALAAENRAYYIDVNDVYDDEDGNLAAEYASDFAHMYGKYYGMWVDWLCTRGIEE